AIVAVAGLFSDSFVMRAALDNTGMQAIRIAPPRTSLADGGIILVAATLDDRGVRVGDIPLIDHAVVVLAAIGDAGRRAHAFILIDVCIPFVSRLGNEGVDIAAVVLLDDRVVALAAVVDDSQCVTGSVLIDIGVAHLPRLVYPGLVTGAADLFHNRLVIRAQLLDADLRPIGLPLA